MTLVAGLLTAAQPANSTAASTPRGKRSAEPPGAPPSDAAIERAIRARFDRSKIRADNFQVSVVQGVATISGKTDVIQRKGVATRLAKLAGARKVDNKIQLSEAARERAVKNLETGRRRALVKRSSEVAR